MHSGMRKFLLDALLALGAGMLIVPLVAMITSGLFPQLGLEEFWLRPGTALGRPVARLTRRAGISDLALAWLLSWLAWSVIFGSILMLARQWHRARRV